MSAIKHYTEPDMDMIAKAFPGKAWAYAVSYHNVQVGIWENGSLVFHDGYDPAYLSELRVFDAARELRWVRADQDFLFRDTDEYVGAVDSLRKLVMYGEKMQEAGETWTRLDEERGGAYFFPQKLSFAGIVELRLEVRDFARFNKVEVLRKGGGYDEDLVFDGRGAFELFDTAFSGFYYLKDGEETEVKL